jgi:hypothetical protein
LGLAVLRKGRLRLAEKSFIRENEEEAEEEEEEEEEEEQEAEEDEDKMQDGKNERKK